MVALAIAGLGTAAANAQSTSIETPSKYTVATNSFWSNWYVQVGVDMALQNPYGAKDWSDNVFPNGKSFGVDVALGKWFTPGLGLRGKLLWENGIIENKHQNYSGNYGGRTGNSQWTPEYDDGGYAALYGDVMFNLSNMFCGYSETRVWNFIPYLRAGVLRSFQYSQYTPALGGGIENTWRLSKHVNVYLDLAYTTTTARFVGYHAAPDHDHATNHGIVTADLGVQFNLGKSTFDKAVSLSAYNALAAQSEEALAKLRAELDRERAINADLRAQLAKKPTSTVQTEKIVASSATSVFFDLNSTKINSQKDLVNLDAVAKVAKDSGAKVVVTGSADSKTGSSAWNQKLSEGRAQAAVNALVERGVSRDKIEVKAVGGINEVSPYPLNRRAVIELK